MTQQYMLHAHTGVSYRNSSLRENPSNHTVVQRIVNPKYKGAKYANETEQILNAFGPAESYPGLHRQRDISTST